MLFNSTGNEVWYELFNEPIGNEIVSENSGRSWMMLKYFQTLTNREIEKNTGNAAFKLNKALRSTKAAHPHVKRIWRSPHQEFAFAPQTMKIFISRRGYVHFRRVQSSFWSCLLCYMLVIKCVAAQSMHGLRPRTYPTTTSCRAILKDKVFICLVISCGWWWWWWQWWYVLALRRFTPTP